MLENLLDFFHALTRIPSKIRDCSHEGNWGAIHKSLHYHCMCVSHKSSLGVCVCVYTIYNSM